MSKSRNIATQVKSDQQDQQISAAATTTNKKTIISCTNQGLFLPSEIITDILSRLPVNSLARFRCVCRQWLSLTSDPRFLDEHLKKGSPALIRDYINPSEGISLYSFVDNKIINHRSLDIKLPSKLYRLTNSVNGLVLAFCSDRLDQYHYLLNPATGDFMQIPRSDEDFSCCYGFALGFNDSTGDYKVVRLQLHRKRKRDNNGDCHCEVFTLGSRAWRKVGDVSYSYVWSTSVFLNGSLHWLIAKDHPPGDMAILTFDIKHEKMGFISIPQAISGINFMGRLTLMKLEWRICLVEAHAKEKKSVTRIWMLRDTANQEWEEKYSINMLDWEKHNGICRPHIIDVIDGKILMQTHNGIYSYDPHRRTLQRLHSNASLPRLNLTFRSLISPSNLLKD